jgi:hypothetical protein
MVNSKPVALFENRFDDGTPTATNTESGDYDVLHIRDMRPYTLHKFNGPGTVYYTIDCGSAKSADALFMMNHNAYAATATISVESSATGAWAGEEVERLAGFTPASDNAFMKTFNPASARYWRIKIVTNAVALYSGIAMLGVKFTFERYPQSGFDPDDITIHADSSISRGGNLLGSVIKYYERKMKLSFKNVTPSWVENAFMPVWNSRIKLLYPFPLAWDITNHDDEVYLVKVPDRFNLKMPYNPVRRSLTLDLEGIVE